MSDTKMKSVPGYGAVPPANTGTGTVIISTPNATATYTASSLTLKPNTLSNVTFTSPAGISSPWMSTNATTNSTKINLDGAEADIVINGHSLTKTLQVLEERLNILVPNPALETEWAELKKLGNAYRKLEADLEEKARMWQALNKV